MNDPKPPAPPATPAASNLVLLIISWTWVGIPLAWGVLETLRTSMALFR